MCQMLTEECIECEKTYEYESNNTHERIEFNMCVECWNKFSMTLEIKRAVHRIMELEYIKDYNGNYDETRLNQTANYYYSQLLERIESHSLESTSRSVFHWIGNVILDTNDVVLHDLWDSMSQLGEELNYFMD